MAKAAITAGTTLALALTLLLMGCSSSATNKQALQENAAPEASCSQTEIAGGSAWIKGQLAAFGKEDFESAYGFASDSFQSGRSLEDFVAIISGSYGFLLDSRSYSVGECIKDGENFFFDARVTTAAGQEYSMMYALEKTTDAWGVNAATVVADPGDSEPVTPIV